MSKRPKPDNPFPTRLEDILSKGLRAGIGALPVLGSPLVEFLAFVIGDPAQERRDDFIRETLEQVIDLEDRFERLDKEALRDNEQFQATFIQATRLSTQSASEEKRKLLQNAIINSAILDIEENRRLLLMQFLERLTPLHVAMLALLDNPSANPAVARLAQHMMGGLIQVVEAAFPELRGSKAISERIAADLESMGLVNGGNLNVTMTGAGLMAQRSTPLGQAFLKFVANPEDLHKLEFMAGAFAFVFLAAMILPEIRARYSLG